VPVVPVMIAGWALAGLFLSLGPSVAAQLLGLHSRLDGGAVVALLTGTGALAVAVLRSRSAASLLAPSSVLLGTGVLAALAGTTADLVPLAAVGTVVAGFGLGASALATFGTFAGSPGLTSAARSSPPPTSSTTSATACPPCSVASPSPRWACAPPS
ncbi:hypothetical protein NGM37_18285, partial [Streptomyces sp. TRM76130]|nr:hypothetical protein [Streptomyces sp. TRM76130]